MIKNEGLKEEFKHVTVPDEQEHIEGLFASGDDLMPVSYTHLTLPTSDLV